MLDNSCTHIWHLVRNGKEQCQSEGPFSTLNYTGLKIYRPDSMFGTEWTKNSIAIPWKYLNKERKNG